MALLTIQRSPTPSDLEVQSIQSQDEVDGTASIDCKSSKSKSQNEDFFACKGAALHLSSCRRRSSCLQGLDDIHNHLKKIIGIMRIEDCLKLVVKLQSSFPLPNEHRYLCIVCCCGKQDTEESTILGVDLKNGKITLGLVLALYNDMSITLDGDGGFKLASKDGEYLFKPISVQALWAAFQSLNRACALASRNSYFPRGLTHTWIGYYQSQKSKISSDWTQMNEWNQMEDVEVRRPKSPPRRLKEEPSERERMENAIKIKLKELMLSVDLETVTVVQLRTSLEEHFEMSLREYRHFIEQETLTIYGQMDRPSQIFEYLFLGSTFNASNLDELLENNVSHILNVTREVDNFFPDNFRYKNIRVYDTEDVDLLSHWEDTHRFISEANALGTCCLVHCKMGISRSASTVIAYAMKEYGWKLDQALEYVHSKRSCIQPNSGFLEQLKTYEGILEASAHRHNVKFRNSNGSPLPYRPYVSGESSAPALIDSQSAEPMPSEVANEHCLLAEVSTAPTNEDAACEEPLNVEKEIFMYKWPGGQHYSKSTSVLSNVSNRSPLSVDLAGAVCSDSGSAGNTERNSGGSGGPVARISSPPHSHHFRIFRGEVLESLDFFQPAKTQTTPARPKPTEFEKLDLPANIMPTKSEPCLSELSSTPETTHLLSVATLRESIGRSRRTRTTSEESPANREMEDTTEEDNQESGGICSTGSRVKLRSDTSWIRSASSGNLDQGEPVAMGAQRDSHSLSGSPTPDDVIFTLGAANEEPGSTPVANQELGSPPDPYLRESIPWNPGTVRQRSGELESRIRSSRSRSNSGGNDVFQESGPPASLSPIPASPATMDPEGSLDMRRVASFSIYETEQIEFQPGLVQRTKQDIEVRAATIDSPSPSAPRNQGAKRASSLHQHRSSFPPSGRSRSPSEGHISVERLSLTRSIEDDEDGYVADVLPWFWMDSASEDDPGEHQLTFVGTRQRSLPSVAVHLSDGTVLEEETTTDPPLPARFNARTLLLIREVGTEFTSQGAGESANGMRRIVHRVDTNVDQEPILPVKHLVGRFAGEASPSADPGPLRGEEALGATAGDAAELTRNNSLRGVRQNTPSPNPERRYSDAQPPPPNSSLTTDSQPEEEEVFGASKFYYTL